jgi:flavin reductase (DIM6/NTAB) family NADH-FMN oxidoreductase RutF
VRPSRFTYGLIEGTPDFTVNVPPATLQETVAFCGMASGRQHDKFKEKGLTPVASRRVKSPIIRECVIHYECRVIHKNDIRSETLPPEILAGSYPKGDFHRVYYGEILAVYADADARKRLSAVQIR